ncbi:TetR/AcrR family transcriptional regulator [Roseinatronobacter bogoriensis]|uniref:TetR/AcrR family transcriptional regulator n=1 Tax=Roseinatronobacter bogoriensis subsp. barguzinensis TaxID=441209 RepID=A0A2K8K9W3_9RHOB|nr:MULTISPECIES: TetR/AcrR family transcriptional regulator [Rhodobaca]ATX64495.1 TetR/AcrR family transcriptional regulator [Rhodobaca barguzinensis]MBB4209207.1 AcrR family transcriptional regulator [Rhodobaca bogoriensis DSM 18756]TDW36267.1 TetR family transcriptional regulator [Rhodobaca barguzinensis]TDY67605.1 TetR family transcriptional regulator [Rhodobaca bogoriensis DSM 18756]
MTHNHVSRHQTDTRTRLLEAAEALSRRLGPGNLSLDAVAAEAGVSKGGLLYHFPSKAKLLEALVAHHLSRLDAALRAEEATGRPNAAITAYMDQFLLECARQKPPASGLLAALAENPQLLEPVRAQESDFLARIRADATDPDFATVAFLVVHAMRAMKMLGTEVLDDAEAQAIIGWLNRKLQDGGG